MATVFADILQKVYDGEDIVEDLELISAAEAEGLVVVLVLEDG
jgi:hypothetical protein